MAETSYRFCRICGSALKEQDNNHFVCEKNNHHIYLNPIPCNAVILENQKGEILLVKRFADPKKGYWDLPGGFTEVDETMEESTKREIKEELGLNLVHIRYLVSVYDRYEYNEDNYHTLCFIYYANINSEEQVAAADDVAEVKYFKKEEIPYEKIAFPSLAKILKDFVDNKFKAV